MNRSNKKVYRAVPKALNPDYAYEIEQERISNASIPIGNKSFFPKKIMSEVDERMVEKYRIQERKDLLNRGFVQPPIELLDEYEPLPYPQRPKEAITNQEYDDKMHNLASEAEIIIISLEVFPEDNKQLDNAFSDGKMSKSEYDKNKQDLATAEEEYRKRLRKLSSEEGKLRGRIMMNKIIDDEYAEEVARLKTINDNKIKRYTDQLTLLNKVIPSKNVNETDEQYMYRLSNYQYDKGNLDEAETFEKNILKKELGKLTKLPLYSLENIIKSLSKNLILSLNERWPLVESEYKKIFAGDVRESSVIDFLQNIFNPKQIVIQNLPEMKQIYPKGYEIPSFRRSISMEPVKSPRTRGRTPTKRGAPTSAVKKAGFPTKTEFLKNLSRGTQSDWLKKLGLPSDPNNSYMKNSEIYNNWLDENESQFSLSSPYK